MSESLADEFAFQIAEGPYTKSKLLGAWAYQNGDRILAALRGSEEDARIARIVRETVRDEESDDIYKAIDADEYQIWARKACRAILALANEAGARE